MDDKWLGDRDDLGDMSPDPPCPVVKMLPPGTVPVKREDLERWHVDLLTLRSLYKSNQCKVLADAIESYLKASS